MQDSDALTDKPQENQGLYYFAKRNETKRNETKRNETKRNRVR